MKLVCSPRYRVDVGPHVFPTAKYDLICEQVLARGLVEPEAIAEPAPATWDELGLVHTGDYLTRLREGRLTFGEIAQLELPWSHEAVEGFRLMAGGTLLAARCALAERAPTPFTTINSAAPRSPAKASGAATRWCSPPSWRPAWPVS